MNFTDIDDSSEHATHTPTERAAAASRSTWVSVAVNLVLSITQIVVGTLAKSQGLIADGVHSLSDLVADFVVLFAGHHAKKDADEDHPYGHHRFETAASLALGLLLLKGALLGLGCSGLLLLGRRRLLLLCSGIGRRLGYVAEQAAQSTTTAAKSASTPGASIATSTTTAAAEPAVAATARR